MAALIQTDRRHVYLLVRTGTTTASLVLTYKMLNARKTERAIHEIFGDSKFTIIKKPKKRKRRKWFNWFKRKKKKPKAKTVRKGKWLQRHYKIGIAKHPPTRVNNINKSKLESGKTEWFAATCLEVLLIKMWMRWFFIKPFIIIILIMISLILFLYIAVS